MHCPSCKQPDYSWDAPCPYCGFDADPQKLEELAHMRWFLAELDDGDASDLPTRISAGLRERYARRLRALEVALHLREPPLSAQAVKSTWSLIFCDNVLLDHLGAWCRYGFLDHVAERPFVDRLVARRDAFLDRVADYPPPADPPSDMDRLRAISALHKLLEELRQAGALASPDIEARLTRPILEEKRRLETALAVLVRQKLTPPGIVEKKPSRQTKPERIAPPVSPPAPEPLPPPEPAIPFRERLWRMLLSERMLNMTLFLGIFLLFAAAVSFVVWGWKDFSPLLRVAIPAGFTTLFFVLGQLVRKKTSLYNSGIALSAIGSLLIPIDFYSLYVNFSVDPAFAPEFWLLTSLVCLAAYTAVTLMIRDRLFGYLVGVAGGSVVLAVIDLAHKFNLLSLDWYGAGLSVLCVLLVGVASFLSRREERWLVFVAPFRYLALVVTGALMPLLLVWRVIDRPTFDALHAAATLSWCLGAWVLGWGALFYRSRGLWMLAATALPVAVTMAQAMVFDALQVNRAWHALGWSALVALYVWIGHRLAERSDATEDAVVRSHARTTNCWAVAMLLVAALWSLSDLSSAFAAACSHALLAGSTILAVRLWRRPGYLYVASALSLTTATFMMTELGLSLVQLCLGWASLAILHILLAYRFGPVPGFGARFAAPLVMAGYTIAALSVLPPLLSYDGNLLAYVLGNWIGLAGWGARLVYQGRPGFVADLPQKGLLRWLSRLDSRTFFHWLAALPLPFWLWVAYTNVRPGGLSLALALAALSWGMLALGYGLSRVCEDFLRPWRWSGLLVSVLAVGLAFLLSFYEFAFLFPPNNAALLAPALCTLSAGLLYFADIAFGRRSVELFFAGPVLALGEFLLLSSLDVLLDARCFAVVALIALYFLVGLALERRRSPVFTHEFLTPLYVVSHVMVMYLLMQIFSHPFSAMGGVDWPAEVQRWGAASLLLLGVVYGLYAWATYREFWAHVAAWLGTAGAAFLVLAYSRGRGSSAAKAALVAMVFVLAERGLHGLMISERLTRRRRALARMAWTLYRRPLLGAGWTVSVAAIGLALVRNLWLLGGGRTRQLWAVAGLLLITGLYALAARLFRDRRFVWFAAILVFAPWTILTDLGWFTPYRLTVPGFAAGWAVLAWVLFLLNRVVHRFAPDSYALPLRGVAHVLMPFALLWGIADVETSRVTFGLAVAFYALVAGLEYRDAFLNLHRTGGSGDLPLRVTCFLYPALLLAPVWAVYLLAWHLPRAPHELYGLLVLAFGPLGLMLGNLLRRVPSRPDVARPAYGLPAYLMSYVSLIVGTLLVAHIAGLLSPALLYDALLLAISARLFRNPVWLYPATALTPVSLLLALNEAGVAGNRHGWSLIWLAVIYFLSTWLLRRVRLHAYGAAPLALGFVLLALALPPSSEDQIGALWGYGSAALVYAVTAFWLKQPLLLSAGCALVVVPYAVLLQRSTIPPRLYGLALLPGAAVALAAGWWFDVRRGRWDDFPWTELLCWPTAFVDRLLGWWGLPFYVLGFGLGLASPFFTGGHSDLAAINCLLLVPLFAWALAYFRLRGWLLALVTTLHVALALYLDFSGWWTYPTWAWAHFLPLTLATVGIGLWIERKRGEGPPRLDLPRFTGLRSLWSGWSRPLYLVGLFDMLLAQVSIGFEGGPGAGVLLSLVHVLLTMVLASVWRAPLLPFVSALLGAFAMDLWWDVVGMAAPDRQVWLAWLAFVYGALGYGLMLWRNFNREQRVLSEWLSIWCRPLRWIALLLSGLALVRSFYWAFDVVGWFLWTLFGFHASPDLGVVRAVVAVFAWLGLLYVTATVAHRRQRLGYAAVAMLLAGWTLHAFFINRWDAALHVQWYAMPGGVYLLGVAFLEWQRGNHTPARWLDYAALFLMIGSLFWQTMRFGWRYALMLLIAEGFPLILYGSARRTRRFFYAGMLGVVLATLGQLINALQDVNQWIVFGSIGLLLIGTGLLIEPRLKQIREVMREVLEDWE